MTTRIPELIFLLPAGTTAERAWLDTFFGLLGELPNATVSAAGIVLTPRAPAQALPRTRFSPAPISTLEVVVATDAAIDVRLPGLRLRSPGAADAPPIAAPTSGSPGLALATLAERLSGHLVRLDHSGLNLPRTLLAPDEWQALQQVIAAGSALYRYPTGEEWPFVVPTTDAELADDIHEFVAGRAPKFELVYDDWAAVPVIQLAAETDLTRDELERLFPEPEGVAFPGLGEFFRTVFVAHPWPSLTLRFDLYYRTAGGQASAWDTAEWLVREGGRIRPPGS